MTDWANKTADSLNYPDMSTHVGATMQFISVDVPGTGSSFYAATHDGAAHAKTLSSAPSTGAGAGVGVGGGSAAGTLSLGFTLTPEGAADPTLLANNRTYTVPFPFVVGVLPRDGTEASWYSASQVYRSWVLSGAHWTKPGPIAHRTKPAVSKWLQTNDVWVNRCRRFNTRLPPGALLPFGNVACGWATVVVRSVRVCYRRSECPFETASS